MQRVNYNNSNFICFIQPMIMLNFSTCHFGFILQSLQNKIIFMDGKCSKNRMSLTIKWKTVNSSQITLGIKEVFFKVSNETRMK